MDDKKLEFLPFTAINEFMRSEYRLEVIGAVLKALPTLPESHRKKINNLIKRYVQVPGFRNSANAPLALKIKNLVPAFEKHPEVASTILSAWSESNKELQSRVYDLLKSRDWEVLPPDTDRTRLPGFLTVWPKEETFDALDQAYQETYAEDGANSDDVSLMAVWLSGRLPYNTEGSSSSSDG